MRIITAEEVDRALGYPALIEHLRTAFREGAVQPVRHHHEIERGAGSNATLLLMPAWNDLTKDASGHIGVKVVTVSPDNNAKGLPAVMGVYLLMEGETGAPCALIDGQRLTLWRTACASALAASYLARDDASKLLMVGAGALSTHLVRAHSAVRPIRNVRIWNRTRANAERIASELRADDVSVEVIDDLEAALGWADIVSCATLSKEPLVKGDLLRPGVHVDLVGAFTPTMRESDDAAIRRARVFVDTRAGATKEAGDIVLAIGSGALSPDGIVADLHDLARGDKQGRESDGEITLFKSVGAALEDLAAGIAVYRSVNGH